MPERPSGVISLTYTQDARLIFFMIFAFFVENNLTGNTKLSFIVLWFKSYRPLQAKGLIFLIIFGFFVEKNHLLENTMRILVSWFKSY